MCCLFTSSVDRVRASAGRAQLEAAAGCLQVDKYGLTPRARRAVREGSGRNVGGGASLNPRPSADKRAGGQPPPSGFEWQLVAS